MTKKETITLIQTLVIYYPASRIKADELTVNLYYEALKDLPGELVSAAVKRMTATLKFPPTIADIRETVAKAVEDARGVPSAGEAWARVKRAISRYGWNRPEEARAFLGEDIWRAINMVGGWMEVCVGESPASVVSAQFERRYNAMREQERELVQIPSTVREEMARLVGPLTEGMRLEEPTEPRACGALSGERGQ